MSINSEQLAGLSAEEQRALLQEMLRKKKAAGKVKTAVLSYGQERLWFLYKLEPNNTAYNLRTAVRLEGDLNVPALAASIQALVDRHEGLRTTFVEEDGRPLQKVHPKVETPLPIVDLTHLDGEALETAVSNHADSEVQAPFDLANGPIFRAKLIKQSNNNHILLLTMHHIISDGWSLGVLVREITLLYQTKLANQPAPLPTLTVQYSDFAEWQREWLEGENLQTQLDYWRTQLDGVDVIDLPTDYPRPPTQTFVGARQYFTIPATIADTFRQLTHAENGTMFMGLLASFSILLHTYSQQTDITVGTPVAGRNRNQLEGLIGLFINTLVMRTKINPEESFRDLLKTVRQTALDAYANQDVPFEKLVEEFSPPRDPSRTPYFQHLLILQNAPMDTVSLPNLSLTPMQPNKASALLDIAITMWDDAEQGMRGFIEYNTDLFGEATIARFVSHFQQLLHEIGQRPDAPINQLSVLTEAEKVQQLQTWNDTLRPYPTKTFTQLFTEQAAKTPTAIAVTAPDGTLTYAELDQKSNQLAAYLRQFDIQPDTLIALSLPRHTQMIITLFGILKAGGAYLDLDPAYPPQRLKYMLDLAEAPMVITNSDLVAELPQTDAKQILLDTSWDDIMAQPTDAIDHTKPDNLAYVIFTSGSTGKPKGVQISHNNITNFLIAMQETPGITPEDVVLAIATLSFDISTLEVFWTLISGARVLLADRITAKDPVLLMNLLEENPVTVMQATPATWQMLLGAGWQGHKGLTLLTGGEALQATLAERLMANDTAVYNVYGPTETTVWSTTYRVTEADIQSEGVVPIGKPIANMDFYILDDQLKPLPVGVTGNLYIGGKGVARGYLNRPDLTAERFVQHPFKPEQRIYFTGDLARFRADGNIEFLGRSDHQVKIRGFRIELGEIENSLQEHAAISHAVVHPYNDLLVAYLIVEGGNEPDIADLRNHILETLPAYMVPHRFMYMEKFPYTPSRKVDRNALPKPNTDSLMSSDTYVPPRSPVEEALAVIWQDLLNVPRVGIEDNFFELGGHSLLATQLVSRVRRVLNVELPLRTLFEAGTIADLANVIHEAQNANKPRIEKLPNDTAEKPLSFSQQRLWVLDQIEPNLSAYHLPIVVRLNGTLNVSALQETFNQLLARHEALRTTFESNKDGTPYQVIHENVTLPLTVEAVKEDEIDEKVVSFVKRPFFLTTPPLIRAKLLQRAENDHLLLIVMHHIISDGWSMNVLMRDVATMYHAVNNNQPNPLPPLPIQYPDFAAWQRNWLQGEALDQQINYWKNQLGGAPETLTLPTDFPRPTVQSFEGATHRHTLSAELTQRINAFSRRANATPFMTLLAAYQLLLARYAGQDDIVVGSPIANRNQSEIENLIGFFLNMLAFRTQIGAEDSFNDVLAQVRQNALDGYAHQDVPFEKLVDALHISRDVSYSPVFQAAFILQNAPRDAIDLGDMQMSAVPAESETSKYDLTLTIFETEAGYRVIWEYATALFLPETISELASNFVTLLDNLLTNPDQLVHKQSLFSPAEQQTMLVGWNATKRPFPTKTLTQMFSEQASKSPNKTAVSALNDDLTYAELNQQSDQLAAYLRQFDITPDTLIGLAVPRDSHMLVAILGILKAGAAYLPIDPTYPAARIQYMLDHAQAPLLLTTADLVDSLPENQAKPILIDSQWDEIEQAEPLAQDYSNFDHLAYVIYTSGSTGKPKGVQISHRNIANFLCCMQEAPGLSADDTLLAVTTLSFDIATLELYLPLISGAKVLLADEQTVQDATLLAQKINSEPVTVMQATPATWQMLLAAGWQGKEGLTILCGGEAMQAALGQKLLTCGTAVWNMYGPTETTVWSTCLQVTQADCETDGVVSIGTPIGNTDVYILDDYFNPVPIGVTGNLYIGGKGVARGYLHRADLTAERFPQHPFKPEERIYFTGDLARYGRNGRIEFLGRSDHQVKIHGFRIELGEIENSLQQYPELAQVVVHPQDEQLVAYLIAQSETKPDVAALRRHILKTLPAYMVPHRFIYLDAFPLTPNNKVDRNALPKPESYTVLHTGSYVAPRSPVEEALVAIWQELLNVPRVGIEDNFFELGGHSLLATQLISKIRQTLHVEVPLRALFDVGTISGLSKAVESAKDTAVAPSITLVDDENAKLLSFSQQRLWILDQLEPNLIAYHIPVIVRLEGEVHIDILQEAFNQLMARHDSLRTTFGVNANGEPIQQVHDEIPLALPVIPVTSAEVDQKIQEIMERPFALNTAPLLRTELLKVAEDHYLLVIVIHHIISDGWSINILVREIATLYHAINDNQPNPLPPLPIQYPDFAAWQRNWLQGEVLDQQINYWKNQLDGAPATLSLPTDFPRPTIQSYRGATYWHDLPRDLSARIVQFSRQANATPFMTLLAAYQLLLSRHSGQDDIVVGSPIANRNRSEIENLIGFFVNMLVFRTQVNNDYSFNDLLAQVKQDALDGYANQDVPFEKLVDALNIPRDMSYSPVFQASFIFQNTPRTKIDLGDTQLTVVPPEGTTSKFDLTLAAMEREDGIRFFWEYCSDLFMKETIVDISTHFIYLLENVLNNPDTKVSELPRFSEAERHQLLVEWNQTERPFPTKTLTQLFAEQARKTPNKTAVSAINGDLTYAQLALKSDQFAAYLRQFDLQPDTLVGLALPRHTHMLVAILGILKAGAAYLPIDPDYPAARVQYMLEHAQTPLLITTDELVDSLPEHQAKIIQIDGQWSEIEQAEPLSEDYSELDNLAYVIYTSGSTGKPKGVQITNGNLANLLLTLLEKPGISEDDTLLALTTLSFDIATVELYLPLICGAKVRLADQPMTKDMSLLIETLEKEPITILQATPATWQMLLAAGWQGKEGLSIFCGGEAMKGALAQQLLQSGTAVWNMYGPTETTVYSTILKVTEEMIQTDGVVSIGTPVGNTDVYILDDQLNPVAIGVTGNLYIGGKGVARGYLHRPELTAERFPQHPFKPEETIYFTGDLARYRRNGRIEFLGRSDHQVKINGFRIELGEIENSLQQHPAITQAVVHPQGEKLVAYMVTTSETAPEITALRAHIQESLPAYMVPHRFLFLDSFPLTPNNKVDRNALPRPDEVVVENASTYVAPRTAVEEQLTAVWHLLLKADQIGIHDNFFELGGDSILAIRFISHAKEIGYNFRANQLFQNQTIAQLAQLADELRPFPLTAVQTNLITDEAPPIILTLNAEAPLNQDKLYKALDLLQQIPNLQLAFTQDADGNWQQQTADAPPAKLIESVTVADDAELDQAIQSAHQSLPQHLSMVTPPHIFATHIHSPNKSVVLLALSPLVVDRASVPYLVNTLAQAYTQGQLPQLPQTMARDWVAAEQPPTDQSYWQAMASQIAPLPAAHTNGTPTPPQPLVQQTLSADYLPKLKRIQESFNMQLQEVVLTAVSQTLINWQNSAHLWLNSTQYHREAAINGLNTRYTVGNLQTHVPLYVPKPAEIGAAQWLQQVKEYGRKVPTVTRPSADLWQKEPHFSFVWQPEVTAVAPFIPQSISAPHSGTGALHIIAGKIGDQLNIEWQYDPTQLSHSAVLTLSKTWQKTLDQLITETAEVEDRQLAPSDFPEANLDQAKLSQFLSKLGQKK